MRRDRREADHGEPVVREVSRSIRKARTATRCWCGCAIEPGETWTRVFMLVDGEPHVERIGHHPH